VKFILILVLVILVLKLISVCYQGEFFFPI